MFFFSLGFHVRNLPAIAFDFDNFSCQTAGMNDFRKKVQVIKGLSRQATDVGGKEVGR